MEKKSYPSEQITVTPAPPITVVVHNDLQPVAMTSEYPVQTTCPKCQQQVVTQLHYTTGSLTWICVIVIFIFFFPLAWAPFCINSCKDVQHYCPSCGNYIGTKKRL